MDYIAFGAGITSGITVYALVASIAIVRRAIESFV